MKRRFGNQIMKRGTPTGSDVFLLNASATMMKKK
jgi:hypothetical protein